MIPLTYMSYIFVFSSCCYMQIFITFILNHITHAKISDLCNVNKEF
jgi:hypothetical protein